MTRRNEGEQRGLLHARLEGHDITTLESALTLLAVQHAALPGLLEAVRGYYLVQRPPPALR